MWIGEKHSDDITKSLQQDFSDFIFLLNKIHCGLVVSQSFYHDAKQYYLADLDEKLEKINADELKSELIELLSWFQIVPLSI